MWVKVVYLRALVSLSDVFPVFVLVQSQRLHFVGSQDDVGSWVPLGNCRTRAQIARCYVLFAFTFRIINFIMNLLHKCGIG